MASEKIITLDGDNFQDSVLESNTPVLVDFWAEWCGPCRMVAPTLDQLADERDDVQIAKLNVDHNQELAMKYQVSSIPTFLLFQGGEVKDRAMGALPKAAFEDLLDRNL